MGMGACTVREMRERIGERTGLVDEVVLDARAPQPDEQLIQWHEVAAFSALIEHPVDHVFGLLVVAVAVGAQRHEVPRVLDLVA